MDKEFAADIFIFVTDEDANRPSIHPCPFTCSDRVGLPETPIRGWLVGRGRGRLRLWAYVIWIQDGALAWELSLRTLAPRECARYSFFLLLFLSIWKGGLGLGLVENTNRIEQDETQNKSQGLTKQIMERVKQLILWRGNTVWQWRLSFRTSLLFIDCQRVTRPSHGHQNNRGVISTRRPRYREYICLVRHTIHLPEESGVLFVFKTTKTTTNKNKPGSQAGLGGSILEDVY